MKWFWAIDSTNTVARPFVADAEDLRGRDVWDLASGEPVASWDPSASFWSTQEEGNQGPDDVLQTAVDVVPVVSQRLRQRLEAEYIGPIQYLPVQVLRSDGGSFPGYSIANILKVVPALDWERSGYDLFPADYFLPERRGEIQGIWRPVLLKAKLDGYDIARLKEYPVTTYVSERFKTAFEDGSFTGYSFREVELR